MNFIKASFITGAATAIKILIGLIVVKFIVVMFGSGGLGKAGQFMSLLTVLTVVSSGGVAKGVIRYVAENKDSSVYLRTYLSNASAIVVCTSFVVFVSFILLSNQFSIILFGEDKYAYILMLAGFVQFLIGVGYFLLSILNGFGDVTANALSIITASLIGMLFVLVLSLSFGFDGALIGLAAIPAVMIAPSLYFISRKKLFPLCYLMPSVNNSCIQKLLKYSAMVLVTVIAVPVVQMVIRNFMAQNHGWSEVGYWQGIMKISDAYLQFIAVIFSVYYLPRLSRLNDREQIAREVYRTIRYSAMFVVPITLLIYIFREYVILLLYSSDFSQMSGLFLFQLVGDVFRVFCYVIAYVIVAKAFLRMYVLNELIQGSLFLLLNYFLVPTYGAKGATYSYALTYFFLFLCVIFVFNFWVSRQKFELPREL